MHLNGTILTLLMAVTKDEYHTVTDIFFHSVFVTLLSCCVTSITN